MNAQKANVAVSIAPMLSVRRGAQAIEFYKRAFGATESFRIDDPSGAVVARLSVQGAEFWVTDESPEHENYSPESVGGATTRMVLTVPNPESVVESSVNAGAKLVWPVADQYGWHLGRILDPYGHHWEIGYPLAEAEPD